MIGSLQNLLGVSLGFNPRNVVTMRCRFLKLAIQSPGPRPFYHQLQTGVRVCLESRRPQSRINCHD